MPEFVIGARGHDFGRHTPDELFTSIGKAGFACTQLAYTKAIEGVKSYADVTPELAEATRAAGRLPGPARGSRPRPRRQRHRLYAEILRINLFFPSSARCRRFQPLHRAFSVPLYSRKIHN